MTMISVDCVSKARAGCGEGPVWDHRDATLWWVDISGERIHAHTPSTGENRTLEAPCLISSLCLTNEGLLIASALGIARLNTTTGELSPLHHPEPDMAGNRLNDMLAGADGSLWAGTMSEGAKGATGALYRYDGDSVHALMSGTTISNGLALTPDGKGLYFIDSVPGVLYCRENDQWQIVRHFDDSTGKPDGLTVDSEGSLWVAICDRGQVLGMDREGNVHSQIDLPCDIVTSCCFGGDDLKTLYITTGTFSMSEAEKAANPLAGGLFAARMTVPGLQSFEAQWPR